MEKAKALDLLDLVSDGKKIHNYVTNTLKGYGVNRERLHVSACAVIHHAMEHGDIRMVNAFFAGLIGRDKDAFRIWAGYVTTVIETEDDSDNVKAKHPMLSYSKEHGFSVRKGSENMRKGYMPFDVRELHRLEPFYIFAKPKAEKDQSALEFVDWLKSLKSTLNKSVKKADEADLNVPADIRKELEIISAKADQLIEFANIAAKEVANRRDSSVVAVGAIPA